MKIALRTPADFGAIIKDRRRTMGLDQATLAARIGVSRLWVNQVEQGKPGAGLGLVLRALRALEIDIATETEAFDALPANAIVTPDINAIVDAARHQNKT